MSDRCERCGAEGIDPYLKGADHHCASPFEVVLLRTPFKPNVELMKQLREKSEETVRRTRELLTKLDEKK